MPSATAKRWAWTSTLSSFCCRMRPGSVRAPHFSSAISAFPGHAGRLRPLPRSRSVARIRSWSAGPCSLRLHDGVADLDAVAGVEQARAVQPVAVVERAVRGAEVLDHRLAVGDEDA